MQETFDKLYLDAVTRVIDEGFDKEDRTSVGMNRAVFGHSFHFDMRGDGVIYAPFMQCRRFAPRIAFYELMWMLNGMTDVSWLKEKNISIWNGNSSEDYLKSIGKDHIESGTIGKGYGHQFRNFNGVDQLKNVYEGIKNNPTGRRHVISLWNPADMKDMALEPCHFVYTFMVEGDVLNLHQHMRSSDILFGSPYNLGFASLFLALMAKSLGYTPGKIFFTATDMHVYRNQMGLAHDIMLMRDEIEDQSKNFNETCPTIKINKELNSLDDILSVDWNDIEVGNFTRGPDLASNISMAV